jgi:hypothetical protein
MFTVLNLKALRVRGDPVLMEELYHSAYTCEKVMTENSPLGRGRGGLDQRVY